MALNPAGWPDDWPDHPCMHEAFHATAAVVLGGAGVDLRCVTTYGPGSEEGVCLIANAPTPSGYYAAAAVAAVGARFNERCALPAGSDLEQVRTYRDRYMRATSRPMPDPFRLAEELFGSRAFYEASLELARRLAGCGGLTGPEVEAIVRPLLGDLIPAPARKAEDPIDDDVDDDDDDTDLADAVGHADGVLDYVI